MLVSSVYCTSHAGKFLFLSTGVLQTTSSPLRHAARDTTYKNGQLVVVDTSRSGCFSLPQSKDVWSSGPDHDRFVKKLDDTRRCSCLPSRTRSAPSDCLKSHTWTVCTGKSFMTRKSGGGKGLSRPMGRPGSSSVAYLVAHHRSFGHGERRCGLST